jgi:non-heme chloroperoxidase
MRTLGIPCISLLCVLVAACAPAPEPARRIDPSSAPTPDTGHRSEPDELLSVRVNGVELQYLVRGHGQPVIFVHGGLADYREWGPVAGQLSSQFRTIVYSRRYNYPNKNPVTSRDHSANIEADDLAALIRDLKLGPVHVAGASYGALTALTLALNYPELVRSLVLAEPPLIRWLPDLPGGATVYEQFMDELWIPAGRAFGAGDTNLALNITLEYFMGSGAPDNIPAEVRQMLLGNIREWEALTTSSDAFPLVARKDVQNLSMPVLMLSGAKSYLVGKLIDAELERLLPDKRRVIVAEATHDICQEQPAICVEAVRAFFASNRGTAYEVAASSESQGI